MMAIWYNKDDDDDDEAEQMRRQRRSHRKKDRETERAKSTKVSINIDSIGFNGSMNNGNKKKTKKEDMAFDLKKRKKKLQ